MPAAAPKPSGLWLEFLSRASSEEGGLAFPDLALEDASGMLVPMLLAGPSATEVLSDYLSDDARPPVAGEVLQLRLDAIPTLVARLPGAFVPPAYLVLAPVASSRILWRSRPSPSPRSPRSAIAGCASCSTGTSRGLGPWVTPRRRHGARRSRTGAWCEATTRSSGHAHSPDGDGPAQKGEPSMKYSINAERAPEAIGPYSQGTTAGRLGLPPVSCPYRAPTRAGWSTVGFASSRAASTSSSRSSTRSAARSPTSPRRPCTSPPSMIWMP